MYNIYHQNNTTFFSDALRRTPKKTEKNRKKNQRNALVFYWVRQAWRVARKRNQLGCGGHAGDLEVKVLYTPGKGKC